MVEHDDGLTNWSHTAKLSPAIIEYPTTAAEVVQAIEHATELDVSVKAMGAGHSFSDICTTHGMLLRLERMRGIISADLGTGLVTVAAGTPMSELNPALWNMGLALPSLGDFDVQTVAGALCTGTHGTGARFGGLASSVRGLQLVTADGQVLDCDEHTNTDVFTSARVSLGALGIITTVTLQTVPAFGLHALQRPEPYPQVIEKLSELVANTDHFQFLWFPHTELTLTQYSNRVPDTDGLHAIGKVRSWISDELLSTTVYGSMNRFTTRRPGWSAFTNRVLSRVLTARQFTERSYRVFATPRRVRFQELEYGLPIAALPSVIAEVADWLETTDTQIAFPVTVRFAAADDVPLSMACERDTCYVAFQQYHRLSHEDYFQAVGQICQAAGGRPHWGKIHYEAADTLAASYPRFEEFLAVRQRLDPARRFSNDYLRRVLGT